MNCRRQYPTNIVINGRQITEVVIDPYYEKKHTDITDAIILELIGLLDGREFKAVERKDDWEYFMVDRIKHPSLPGRQYRLIWCIQDPSPDSVRYLGVINCFRR